MKSYSWIPFSIIAIDQMTKRVATQWTENVVEWTPFLQGKTVWNQGISFGLLSESYYNMLVFALVCLGLILVFVAWLRAKSAFDIVAWGLVVGGGISNLWDRWNFGAVLDFIYFHFGSWSFPIFNFADIAISLGALILVRRFFWGKNKKSKVGD